MKRLLLLLAAVVALTAILLHDNTPSDEGQRMETQFLAKLQELEMKMKMKNSRSDSNSKDDSSNDESLISVVSFNIRLDAEESNPDNHFTKRVSRLARFFNTVRPTLAGLQEPFSGQLLHLESELTPGVFGVVGRYRRLSEHSGAGTKRKNVEEQEKEIEEEVDRAHPSRMSDFQTAILYDKTRLTLAESDHFWLSETPRVEQSRSWGSVGSRTVTIAAFRRNNPVSLLFIFFSILAFVFPFSPSSSSSPFFFFQTP